MKMVLKILGVVVALALVVVLGGYIWATRTAGQIRSATYQAHVVDFPIPAPLDSAAAAGLDPAAAADSALASAVARGRHLVNSRYACIECHGEDLGGGTMIDAFPMGTLLGPNLTLGSGSVTASYTAREGLGRPARHSPGWSALDDAIGGFCPDVRSGAGGHHLLHPLRPVGRSNHACADAGSDRQDAGGNGPVADAGGPDRGARPAPPAGSAAVRAHGRLWCSPGSDLHRMSWVEPGRRLITAGDPSWPPARNLTPDPSGLASWEHQDFVRAMREGVRKDGTSIRMPMTLIMRYAQAMTDVELEALWVYLRSLPPVATSP